jgi:hypothetical protein
MRSSRFLWVDLQIKAICDACEEDGTPNRIADLLETLPRELNELYSITLIKLYDKGDDRANLARKAFQWIAGSRREMTIDELEEAISTNPQQKSWRASPFKLNISRLSKMCGNLIAYDKANNTVWLAHHSVLHFLSSCSNKPGISTFHLDEDKAEQYLSDICITYLSFVDFHKSITRTVDTSHVQVLN